MRRVPKMILVTGKTNIRYFSGFTGSKGYLVLRGRNGFLFTDARYHLVARTQIPSSFGIIDITKGFSKAWRAFVEKYRIRRIGFEGENMNFGFWRRLKKISKPARLSDIGDALNKRRIVKTAAELANIKRAQKIAEKVFAKIKNCLRSGVTEKQIAWKIECLAHEFGADEVSFKPIVAFAENSAAPHHQNTDRKLRHGDSILIDMGVKYNGFCSDMTRVLFTAQPTPEQKKVFEMVLKAQTETIKKIRAGATGKFLDSVARGIIKKAGFGKNFSHPSGHGVGLDIHELPNLSQKHKKRFPAGCVVTVEPGIYLPDKFGVRIEDMVLVGKKKAVNLTGCPKSIQDSIIKLE